MIAKKKVAERRSSVLVVRMNKRERAALSDLADKCGEAQAETIRRLVAEACSRLGVSS